MRLLPLAVIISALPNTISNGQTADAIPLMADLNHIVNQVNANAAPLSNTAVLNATNSFTQVQTGVAATSASNFPIAGQVQNQVFNTLSSTLGSNTINARSATLTLGAYALGQVFTFIPSQPNTGPVSINIDSLGSAAVQQRGAALLGSEFIQGSPVSIELTATAPPIAQILGGVPTPATMMTNTLTSDVALANIATYATGPSVAWPAGVPAFAFGTVTVIDAIGASAIDVKLWDGTTVIASARGTTVGGTSGLQVSLAGPIKNPTGNIRMSVRDVSSASGAIRFNLTGEGKDSSISVWRYS